MTDTDPSPFDYDTHAVSAADTLTPADRYQELFVAVQTQRVFPDSRRSPASSTGPTSIGCGRS